MNITHVTSSQPGVYYKCLLLLRGIVFFSEKKSGTDIKLLRLALTLVCVVEIVCRSLRGCIIQYNEVEIEPHLQPITGELILTNNW